MQHFHSLRYRERTIHIPDLYISDRISTFVSIGNIREISIITNGNSALCPIINSSLPKGFQISINVYKELTRTKKAVFSKVNTIETTQVY